MESYTSIPLVSIDTGKSIHDRERLIEKASITTPIRIGGFLQAKGELGVPSPMTPRTGTFAFHLYWRTVRCFIPFADIIPFDWYDSVYRTQYDILYIRHWRRDTLARRNPPVLVLGQGATDAFSVRRSRSWSGLPVS